jgi:hypothetical protein
MNPNSAHQTWSFWEYRIYPDGTRRPDFATVKANCSRFGRLLFGSASEMHLSYRTDGDGRPCWEVQIRTEGHPVHDPQYTEWMHDAWHHFFQRGFGPSCLVWKHVRLEAGDRQDGTPADQLILLPALAVEE